MSLTKITDDTYKAHFENTKTVVKFYADWCGSCRLFSPKFKRLAEDERFGNIRFFEVNAEENPEIRKTAEVASLPYFAVYENGEFKGGVATAKEEALVELIQSKLA